MQIRDLLCVAGRSGYMIKDLQAIRTGRAKPNGFSFDGDPITPGFSRITQPGDISKRPDRMPKGSTRTQRALVAMLREIIENGLKTVYRGF